MEVDELMPFEKVIDQVQCTYPKSQTGKSGVMIITSCRVLWKPSAEASFPVQIFRAPILKDGKQGIKVQKKMHPQLKAWVLMIKVPETAESPEASYFFRFFEAEGGAEACAKVELLLQESPEMSMLQRVQFLSPQALHKLELLAKNEALREDFRDHVVDLSEKQAPQQQQKWDESEFWGIYKDQIPLESNENEDNEEVTVHRQSFVRGVSNQPLRLTRRQNNQTQKIEYQLTKDDCMRLLLEYPELNKAYELHVKLDAEGDSDEDEQYDPDQMDVDQHTVKFTNLRNKAAAKIVESNFKTNREFWNEFLKKNLNFQTEPFGGNNPIFIPFESNEQTFEEKYFSNEMAQFQEVAKHIATKNQQVANLGKEDKEKLKKLKERSDVNFIRNLHLDEMPIGFGTFQSRVEIDALHSRMEVCVNAAASTHNQLVGAQDQDLTKTKRREEEQDLMANRVISKFNNNSERILKMLVKQKKSASKEFLYDSMDRKDRLEKENVSHVADLLLPTDFDQLYNRQKIIESSDKPVQQPQNSAREKWSAIRDKLKTQIQRRREQTGETSGKVTQETLDTQNRKMMITQALFHDESVTNLALLESHSNLTLLKRTFQLDDNQLNSFKFQSKTLYLKLKHFYSHLEAGQRANKQYEELFQRYQMAGKADRKARLIQQLQETQIRARQEFEAVKTSHDVAWKAVNEIASHMKSLDAKSKQKVMYQQAFKEVSQKVSKQMWKDYSRMATTVCNHQFQPVELD